MVHLLPFTFIYYFCQVKIQYSTNFQNIIDVDIFERVKKQRGNIGQYAKEAHGYFAFPKLEGEIGPRMMFRGKEVLNWSLNNYIGLANDPESRCRGSRSMGAGLPDGSPYDERSDFPP